LLADLVPRLLVQDRALDLHGRDLFLEEALFLPARRPLLALQRILVLGLPTDVVALGHHLGGVAHDHVETGVVLLHPQVPSLSAAVSACSAGAAPYRFAPRTRWPPRRLPGGPCGPPAPPPAAPSCRSG